MRVVGYVCEFPVVASAEAAFAQWERIRRWVDDRGELLIAVCQDDAAPRTGDRLAGLRAVLALLDGGAADTVVVASIGVLGSDPADQEVALWEMRRRGGTVRSTDPADQALLDGEDSTGERKAMRRLLETAEATRQSLNGT